MGPGRSPLRFVLWDCDDSRTLSIKRFFPRDLVSSVRFACKFSLIFDRRCSSRLFRDPQRDWHKPDEKGIGFDTRTRVVPATLCVLRTGELQSRLLTWPDVSYTSDRSADWCDSWRVIALVGFYDLTRECLVVVFYRGSRVVIERGSWKKGKWINVDRWEVRGYVSVGIKVCCNVLIFWKMWLVHFSL